MADNINISDLSFEAIRQSLVDYLKKQDTLTDYDFEGSAIRTIIDLLAYNTFYYGYYANMISNEMFLDTAKLENSMISLTKPLGYLVPKYYSSRSSIRLSNLTVSSTTLSRFSIFKGFSVSGRPYFFYTIKPVTIANNNGVGETEYFDIFEGRTVTKRQLVTVNTTTQSFVLEGDRIDPRTIIIEVQESEGEPYSEWLNFLNNPDSIVGPNTEIFFVERTKTGYRVNFGKQTSSDISSANTGKMIEQGNKVYVSYLTSSGEDANQISSFQFVSDGSNLSVGTPTTSTIVLYPSKNGVSTPDLDEIRFFAPKTFAKQNRLVTKGDYYAMLNELGYGSGNNNPDFTYKVFGGEEATPPVYGRVFVSLIDLNLVDNDNLDFSQTEEINQILSVLKNKSVVSILPEYIPPVEYQVSMTISGSLPGADNSQIIAAREAVKSRLITAYGTKKYNQDIIEDDIIEQCRIAVPGLILSQGGVFVTITVALAATENQRKINLKNNIDSIEIIQPGSSNYGANEGRFVYIYNSSGTKISNDPAGEFIAQDGIVILYANKFPTAITIRAKPKNDIFYAKDEIVAYINSSSNITVTII